MLLGERCDVTIWTGRSRRIDASNSLTEKCENGKTCEPSSSDDGDQAGACGERHLFLTLPSPVGVQLSDLFHVALKPAVSAPVSLQI